MLSLFSLNSIALYFGNVIFLYCTSSGRPAPDICFVSENLKVQMEMFKAWLADADTQMSKVLKLLISY